MHRAYAAIVVAQFLRKRPDGQQRCDTAKVLLKCPVRVRSALIIAAWPQQRPSHAGWQIVGFSQKLDM